MSDPVLVVDDDPFVLGMLSHVGRARGHDVVGVRTTAEALAALDSRTFGVAVVDLRLGAESGLDIIKRVRALDGSMEAIVISADRRLTSALESYEQDVFAFVPKPFDPAQLFATVDRALERRRGAIERHRLTWELQLVNEVAEIVSSSLELGDALTRALERVAEAFAARWALLRVIPIGGGPARVRAAIGVSVDEAQAAYDDERGEWPTDRALRDRAIVRIADAPVELAPRGVPGAGLWKSTVAVPIVSGDAVLGALSLVSVVPGRFTESDDRVLLTIGRQFGVAVANGQLYERVHRAKVEWERTFDAISDPIAVFDRDRRTMRTNAALAALRGWKITETQGRTCDEVGFCGGRCPDCLVGRSIGLGRRFDEEITTADGRIFAVTTLPVPGASGSAVQFAKEVTEEREQARRLRNLSQELSGANAELVATLDRLRSTQAQLVQSEKLSAIGQLVAGVAHELNNPLTSVIGYAQLVHEQVAATPALAKAGEALTDDVSRILSEADRAARIVRNLLTFARRQSAERVRHDPADLAARVIDLRTYDLRIKGIDVRLNLPQAPPPVFVDGGQIQQALLNLVLNAEQAMKDSTTKELEISLVAEPACGAVLYTVRDTGHGIEPANVQRVFDPFYTTRGVGEGTGLGLSIVYGLIRDHGGQIWAESEVGIGTRFFVRLPARFDADIDAEKPLVLVAHGDAVIRDFLASALGGWGYPVRVAHNTREALESLSEDELGLLVVDRTVVEPDPARWREAWTPFAGRTPMIAVGVGAGESEPQRFLREAAKVALAPPYDLCQLRRAVVAAFADDNIKRRQ